MSIGRFISTTNVGIHSDIAPEYDTSSASANRDKLSGYRDGSVMSGTRAWRSTLDYSTFGPPYQVPMSSLKGTARLPPITFLHGLSYSIVWNNGNGSPTNNEYGFVSPADKASHNNTCWSCDLPSNWQTGDTLWGWCNYGFIYGPNTPISLGSLSGGIASTSTGLIAYIPALFSVNNNAVLGLRQMLYNSTKDEFAIKIGSSSASYYQPPATDAVVTAFVWPQGSGSETPSNNPFIQLIFSLATTLKDDGVTTQTYTTGASGTDYCRTFVSSGYGQYYNNILVASTTCRIELATSVALN
jgi:hypothetical protein